MKILCVMVALVVAVEGFRISDIIREEWNVFKLEYKKQYRNVKEELHHLKTYLRNRHLVAKHNKRFERGLETSRLKTNKFSDVHHSKLNKTSNGFYRNTPKNNRRTPAFLVPHNVTLPATKDWRELGAVTDVKDQGLCCSCWAFSTTGALEGQLYRKYDKLVSLSEQNLIDCYPYRDGCEGGDMNDAFYYVMVNKGIDKEILYPYEAVVDLCRYNPKYSAGDDVGYIDIPEGDEMKLMAAVATVGPVAVAVDGSSESFHFYESGVYYNGKCTNESNHAMLVVGYGTDEKVGDYWLLKNSWGENWGESGYMRLARNRNNHCGVASFASYPLV